MGTKRMRVTRIQILIQTKSNAGWFVSWEIVCMIPANGSLQGTVDQHYLLGARWTFDPVIKELVEDFQFILYSKLMDGKLQSSFRDLRLSASLS